MNAIQKSIPYIARVLSDSTGVEVVFGGARAYTNGKKIFVPMVEPSPLGSSLTMGYLAHESAHCRFSDFSHESVSTDPFTNKIAGIVEDLWIERKMLIEFPGARKHIDTCVERVFGSKNSEDSVTGKNESSFHNFVLLFGRARVLSQDIQVAALVAKFEELFGDGLAQAVLNILAKTHATKSSLDNLRLAEDLVRLYQDVTDALADANAQPDADAQGDADAQPDADAQGDANAQPDADAQGDANAQPDADAQGDANAQPDADAQGDANAKPDADAQGNANAQAGTGDDAVGEYLPELGDLLGEMLKGLAAEQPTGLPVPLEVTTATLGCPVTASKRFNSGRLNAASVRQSFRAVIQGKRATQVFHRDCGRNLDRHKLARVTSGQREVFIHRTERDDTNCAIQLLMDVSGSMAGAIDVAETALMGVLDGLDGLPGVTTGAMAFPSRDGKVIQLKRHNERFKSIVQKGKFGLTVNGSTPLAEALWPTAIELLREADEHARKILIVITDGEPNDADQTIAMTKEIQKSGVDVFCLGFGAVEPHFLQRCYGERGVNVKTVGNLSKSLFQILKKQI